MDDRSSQPFPETLRSPMQSVDPELIARWRFVRAHSIALTEHLSDEDCCIQSMPDASPAKWHLAHTTWFFETFLLERLEPLFCPYDPAFRVLFNSYYEGVGERFRRADRGLLSRPSRVEVLAYRRHVDQHMEQLLAASRPDAERHLLAQLLELGVQHEQQHQELIVTDLLHVMSYNPLSWSLGMAPTLAAMPQNAADTTTNTHPYADADHVQPEDFIYFREGLEWIGACGDGFCFDNELPRHRRYLDAFEIGRQLVSNAAYLRFVEAGGYRDPAFWLSEGWHWVNAEQVEHPFYWRMTVDDTAPIWRQLTPEGLTPLVPDEPVSHLSYFEADAYARWAGCRLPTEAEWEIAASANSDSDPGLEHPFGAVWQWTSSSYAPYPGFRAAAGAVGEYNGKFMVNQYVLRGSSRATPTGHARLSYRNFFPSSARWQFTGLRLARDIGA